MISLSGFRAAPINARFDIIDFILSRAEVIENGDVLVISSKFLAIAEGNSVELDRIKAGDEAKKLASVYGLDERLAELVVRESEDVIGGIPGFLLAVKDATLAPNAGIDRSNIENGKVVLYPADPAESARRIRESVKFATGASIGVVVCDSRLSPTRRGTTGVAISASGFESVRDRRGAKDLFGNILKVTSQAVADDICSAAELLMGESNEAVPIVLVKGLDRSLVKSSESPPKSFAIPADECVYMRSLGHQRELADIGF